MGNMATYRPASTQQNSWNSMKADMRAYNRLQGCHDQIVDTTPHDCELCGLNYGGFDLIMHLHFGHKVDYFDICPCDGCVLVQLNKSIEEEQQQTTAFARIEKFFAESEKQKTVRTATVPMVDLTASPVFSGQLVKSTPVAQHHNGSVVPSANRPQQQYAPVKASPSLSSFTTYAVQGTLAPMGNAQVIRIDSMSPAPQLSSPFTPDNFAVVFVHLPAFDFADFIWQVLFGMLFVSLKETDFVGNQLGLRCDPLRLPLRQLAGFSDS